MKENQTSNGKRKKISRKKKLLIFGIILLILTLLSMWGFTLKTEEYKIKSDKIDKGLKIVFVSDLHNCFYGGTDQSKLKDEIENAEPDILIFGGDMVDQWGGTKHAITLMEWSAKKYPCFYTPGNHEYERDDTDNFFKKVEEIGVTVCNGDYSDIELSFSVSDSEDWMADPVAKETVHVYPYGEDKAVQFVREPKDTDKVLVDNEYVTAIVTGYEDDEIWGYTVQLFLINKTDKDLMFSVDDAAVNGFMADPIFAEEVFSGKCAFSSMSWSDTDLAENNITKIEEIEFKLRVYDLADIFAEDIANEPVTLNP